MKKYDYIITNKISVISTNIVNYNERIKNEMKYISKCVYHKSRKGKLTMVECEIPFEYFQEQGFRIDEAYNGKKYTILYK